MAFLIITNISANPTVGSLGGIVYITATTWSTAGALTSAGTSTLIQITAPDSTIVQSFTAMTADSTGKFSYAFATATSNLPGRYSVEIKTTDSGNVSTERGEYLFTLFDPPA